MLQLEDVAPDDDDDCMAFDSDDGHAEITKGSLYPEASSDGYSPVAIDGDMVVPSKPRAQPVAPQPTTRRALKSWVAPARHDVHVPLQSRRAVFENAPARPASSTCIVHETQAKQTEMVSKDSISDAEGESAGLALGYVNRKSVALLRKSDSFEPDFQARMERFQLKSRQKKEELRQRAAVKEQAGAHMPEINKCSKRLRRQVSHLFAWQNEKENKLTRLRAQEATKEVEACEPKPAVGSRSKDLLAHRGNEIAGCKVEDRLQLLGLIYQHERDERVLQQQQQQQVQRAAGPRLAPHSVNLSRARESSIFDRLYEQSKHQRQSTAPDRMEHDVAKASARRHRASTGRQSDVVQRLYVMADGYKQKRIQRSERRAAQEDEVMLAAPKLSARSRQLVMKTRRQPSSRRKSARLCPCCALAPSDCTQQQQQQQVTRHVDDKSANEIYEKHVRWQQQREAWRLVEKQRAEEARQRACTFRNPWFHPAWGPLNTQSSSASNEAFYRRSVAWAERREQTLDAEKRVWQELEMMECTFRPQRGDAAGATRSARRKAEGRPEYEAVTGSRCPSSDGNASPQRLADYTATDIEALASTSCSDWSGRSDESDEYSDEYSEESGESNAHREEGGRRAALQLCFNAADVLEFAGR